MIPTDEEIAEASVQYGAKETGLWGPGFHFKQGAQWVLAQLKPTLDLVEQGREARKERDRSWQRCVDYGDDRWEKANRRLLELREKLELEE